MRSHMIVKIINVQQETLAELELPEMPQVGDSIMLQREEYHFIQARRVFDESGSVQHIAMVAKIPDLSGYKKIRSPIKIGEDDWAEALLQARPPSA